MIDKILESLDDNEVVEVCQNLVRLKTVNPPGDELALAEYAGNYLKNAGLEVELLQHTAGRASVMAWLRGSGEIPGLICSAHLDTVPVGVEKWKYDPFGGELAEGKIWGRGSSDMKSGMAAMMVAAKELKKHNVPLKGDVILAFTAGEEVDSLGAVEVAKRDDIKNVQGILVSEPSLNEIFVAEKGALWIEVTTYGKTAHGSMPDFGRNAVMMMNAFINEFTLLNIPYTNHHLLGGFSRSVNTINGGVKTNVVPDLCTLTIDMRTVPGQVNKEIIAQIEALLADMTTRIPDFKADFKVLNDRLPITTAEDHPLVGKFNKALAEVRGRPAELLGVRYYTDAAAIVPVLDIPMVICGAGDAALAHQPNEFVEVGLLQESVRIYINAISQILG